MASEEIQEAPKLPEGLKTEDMPKHVAVIPDGNRRWAKGKGLPMGVGYIESKRVIIELVNLSIKWGIKVLSIFSFSTENWKRPQDEIDFLILTAIEAMEEAKRHDGRFRYPVRLSFIGDRSILDRDTVDEIDLAEEMTKHNKGLHVLIAGNYSGKYDILQATRSIAENFKNGIISQVEDINESLMDKELVTSCAEYLVPDLLIRTSGEQRISNFMLWQLAYTELFFCEKNFPEFGE